MSRVPSFLRSEWFWFWTMVLVHLIPVFSYSIYPTLDGPAHVYNSRLLLNLLQGDELTSALFALNGEIVPNWFSHATMAGLHTLFPALLAEKFIQILCILLLPVTARFLVRSIKPKAYWAGFLFFPFAHSFAFYLGFYNYCLGLSFYFAVTALWLRGWQQERWTGLLYWSGLMMVLYFTHLMALILFLGTAGVWMLIRWYKEHAKPIKPSLLLVLAALPSVFLTLLFILNHRGTSGGWVELTLSGKLLDILNIRPLITLAAEPGIYYSRVLFVGYLLMLSYHIFIAMKKKSARYEHGYWLLLAGGTFVLYLIVPDGIASGGFIVPRLAMLFFLFVLVWFSVKGGNKYYLGGLSLLSIAVSCTFLTYHMRVMEKPVNQATEYYEMEAQIAENSIVLPLNYSSNWLHSNYSNYLGVGDKGILVLENYETNAPHFPLVWKTKPPAESLGNFESSNNPRIDIAQYEAASGQRIDYICRWSYNELHADSTTHSVSQQIDDNFELIFTTSGKRGELFARRSGD